MEKLFFLFLFFHVSSPVKHSLEYFMTGSSGITNFPEFMATVEINGTLVRSCDTIRKKVEPRQDWMRRYFEHDPEHLQWCEYMCFVRQPNLFKDSIKRFMQLFNQTGGVHILQGMFVFEWDDESGEVVSSSQFGYDGEDVISFDVKTESWIALKPEAETVTQSWNAYRTRIKDDEINFTQFFPELLKKFVAFIKGSEQKKELPSVFLLQQTPSSPVRCFASGFYPERASLFWRKDGDDLHEDVELGEILPNDDGTFQMSVDLNISSVTPEDWRRYECVFQLSGVKDDIVTKLNKTAIRTNWRKTETPSNMAAITAAVVVVALVLIVAVGIAAGYKLKKKKEDSESSNECTAVNVQVEQPLMKDQQASSSSSSSGSQEEVH